MSPRSKGRSGVLARLRRLSAGLALALTVGSCATPNIAPSPPLRLASWNLEHLAADGARGCRPRTEAEYAALRAFATRLDADVIAFQEVESAAAAARVFDPDVYDIVIEQRPEGAGAPPPCRGLAGRTLTRQAVGFAIRRSVSVDRAPDLTALQVGDPNLRSGVDITVRRGAAAPLRLLAVHLKSGCAAGRDGDACAILDRQTVVMEQWIDARARERVPFAVVGDFNRRLGLPGDRLWTEIDDGKPSGADLALAAGSRAPRCDPRFTSFIDHIVLDRRAAHRLRGFEEPTYDTGGRLSDHCPIVALIR